MFLCPDCHDDSCPMNWLEASPLGRSRGACESCHKVAVCFDCHGYKIQRPTSTPTAEETR